ncbi:MAG TPA: DUF4403 family protein, partial [Gemmatimonadales bacterium]|nr:DUF4403 family protein [Gemmatimonadales bacterium]
TASLLLGCAACGEHGGTVDAPAPDIEFGPELDSLPALPPGTIIAPISLDRAAALAAFERTVPTRLGDIDQRQQIPGSKRTSYAFELAREPFAIGFAGDTVILVAVVHYKGRAWYDPPIGPELHEECGTGDEVPRARLVLRALPRLSKDWKIRVRTRLMEIDAATPTERDQCEVSFLHLDLTKKVLGIARQAIEKILPDVERKIARVDVQTPLAKLWSDLQNPIRLQDSLWLLLVPSAVHLGSVHGESDAIIAEIGITASPRIVTGSRPILVSVPLPPLGAVRTDPGFAILIEGAFSYSVMSSQLTKRLAGRSVKAGGGTLKVKHLTVLGVGAGRLALGLDFEGSARGRVWFLGTPSYDPVSGLVSVPDLDFDTRSAGMLVQGLAWLKANAIREFLRSQAKVPAGALLGHVQTVATKQMNRELAPGVQLNATIEQAEPAGILVRSNGLIIRARATGTGRLTLGREIFEKKTADH